MSREELGIPKTTIVASFIRRGGQNRQSALLRRFCYFCHRFLGSEIQDHWSQDDREGCVQKPRSVFLGGKKLSVCVRRTDGRDPRRAWLPRTVPRPQINSAHGSLLFRVAQPDVYQLAADLDSNSSFKSCWPSTDSILIQSVESLSTDLAVAGSNPKQVRRASI